MKRKTKTLLFILTITMFSFLFGGCEVPETKPTPENEKEYVNISCADFHKRFGTSSKLSNLQKDKEFKEFKDKYVKWTATISSVDETLGTLQMQVKCLKETFVSDAIISFPNSEREKLENLKEGSIVKFSARLTDYGQIMSSSLNDGKIL